MQHLKSLYIINLDGGKYQLFLENSVDRIVCDITLQVLDKPDVPQGPVEFSNVEPHSLTLKWNEPLHDGGSPVVNYIVELMEGTGRK